MSAIFEFQQYTVRQFHNETEFEKLAIDGQPRISFGRHPELCDVFVSFMEDGEAAMTVQITPIPVI